MASKKSSSKGTKRQTKKNEKMACDAAGDNDGFCPGSLWEYRQ